MHAEHSSWVWSPGFQGASDLAQVSDVLDIFQFKIDNEMCQCCSPGWHVPKSQLDPLMLNDYCICKVCAFTHFPERHLGLAEMCLPQIVLKRKWIHPAFFGNLWSWHRWHLSRSQLLHNPLETSSRSASTFNTMAASTFSNLILFMFFVFCSAFLVLCPRFSSCVLCPVLQSRRK